MDDAAHDPHTRRLDIEHVETPTATSTSVPARSERSIALDEFLFRERKIYLIGGVNEDSAQRIVLALHALAQSDPAAEITLYVDSPGGQVVAGNAILDAMDEIPCDIRTRCLGQAASMGAIIFAHGTLGKREVGPKARILIHQPSSGTSGRSTDEEIDVAETRRLRKQLAISLAEDAGQTPENVERDFKDDLWLNAAQAIEYGLADSVLAQQRKGFEKRAMSPPSERATAVLAARAAERAASGTTKPTSTPVPPTTPPAMPRRAPRNTSRRSPGDGLAA